MGLGIGWSPNRAILLLLAILLFNTLPAAAFGAGNIGENYDCTKLSFCC